MNLIEITTNEFDVTINLAYAKSSNFTGEYIKTLDVIFIKTQ